MQVSSNKVVTIDYKLKNDEGTVIYSSENRDPLSYIQGAGRIIPGLEDALVGKEEGESFSVAIEPDKAYGEYDSSLVFNVPKNQFQEPDNIKEGMRIQVQMQDGKTRAVTIKDIGEQKVSLDANHPLAGKTLHFDIEVKEVREATSEELEQGKIQQ